MGRWERITIVDTQRESDCYFGFETRCKKVSVAKIYDVDFCFKEMLSNPNVCYGIEFLPKIITQK